MMHLRDWFWSLNWGPEPRRFLAAVWPELDTPQRRELLESIVEGPKDAENRSNIEEHIYGMLSVLEEIEDDSTQFDIVKVRFDDLKKKFADVPDWQIQGFVSWHSSPAKEDDSNVGVDEDQLIKIVREAGPKDYPFHWKAGTLQNYVEKEPKRLRGLIDRLGKEGLLSDRVFATILYSVAQLPAAHWPDPEFLQIHIDALPSNGREHLAFALAELLRTIAKAADIGGTFWQFFGLAHLAAAPSAFDRGTSAFEQALNHPLGRIAGALFESLAEMKLSVGATLPGEAQTAIRSLLADAPGRPAAISIISTRIAFLHAVDPAFTEEILWIFTWARNEYADVAWSSFLFHPRWHRSLFDRLKPEFSKTAENADSFDDNSQRTIGGLLAQVSALEGLLDPKDTRKLLRSTTAPVFEGVANQLADRLKLTESGLRDGLWEKSLRAWFENCWPRRQLSDRVSAALARFCAYLRDRFADAVDMFAPSIGPVQYPLLVLTALKEEGHHERPSEAVATLLELLSRDGIGFLDDSWSDLITPLTRDFPDLPVTKKLIERSLKATRK